MKRIIVYILFILLVINSGCGSSKNVVTSKQESYLYKNSSLKISKGINVIDIKIDSGNLQLYCWDKKEIKFETKHTIRDNKTKEQLDNLLKKFSIISEENDKTFIFTVDYKNKIKNSKDIFTDIKLTIPRCIKKINITQQLGSMIIEDKYEGNLSTQLASVNSEIKSIKGQLDFRCDNGYLRVNSGKLSNSSNVQINSGSIFLKAQCEDQSKYSFQTNTGNIDLNFPVASNIFLESFGTVQNNQFAGNDGNIEIKASTKIGKISVNGY